MRTGTTIAIALALATGATLQEDALKTLPVGASAPDFSLPGVDGKT